MTTTIEVKVLDEKSEAFAAAIAKLNKQARKVGVTPLVVNKTGEEKQDLRHSHPHPLAGEVYATRVWHLMAVSYEPIKLAGWTFIAKIDGSDPACVKPMLRVVPGESLPLEFRDVEPERCDHCRTARRRNLTYVVRHDSGEHKQVGSTCLRDFLGTDPNRALAWMDQCIALASADDDGESWGGGGGWMPKVFDRDMFMTAVVASVRLGGWLSNGAARAKCEAGDLVQSTSDCAMEMIIPSRSEKLQDEQRKFWAQVTEHDKRKAAAIAPWVLAEFTVGSLDDYKYNLKNCLESGLVSHKTAGIVASAIVPFDREIQRRVSRTSSNEHVGTVGKRDTFKRATIVGWHDRESEWGVTRIIKFQLESGAMLVWFASSSPKRPDSYEPLEIGDCVDIKATVKAHGEFRGDKQTTITRATVLKLHSAAAESAPEMLAVG